MEQAARSGAAASSAWASERRGRMARAAARIGLMYDETTGQFTAMQQTNPGTFETLKRGC